MKTTYIIAGAICLIVATGATVYVIQNKPKSETEQSQNQSNQTTDSKPVPNDNKPAEDTFSHSFTQDQIKNIAAIFNTMDTQPMLGYFAEKVALVYDKAEPSTLVARDQAPKALEYFDDAKEPWDFFLSQADIDAYKSKSEVAKYFGANCLVGRSADGTHVVSLCTDKSGEIDTIFMRR